MPVQPEIRPLSQARRKIFLDLGTRNGRDRRGLFLLDAPRAIEEAMAKGARIRWIVVDESGAPLVERWAAEGRLPRGVEVTRATRMELEAIADATAVQGVVAAGVIPPHGPADLPAELGQPVLVADGIQDPGNLGTLLRTLAAVGGRAAILCKGTVDAWNPKTLRGAAGATFGLAIAAGVEPAAAADLLAERGVAIVALRAGAPSLFEARLPDGPLALAVGNEGAGLSPVMEARAALVLGLPMAQGVESLSAAVAGSVAMVALANRLRAEGR